MDDKVLIRKYRSIDKESCRSLWRELTEWHRQIYQEPSIGGSHPEEYFDKHLKKVGADNLWVAILNSRVIGLTGLIIDEEEAEIEPLIVSEKNRKKGIGKLLVETMINEIRKQGIKMVNVRPVARNKEAIDFFYNRGFKNVGHIQLFIDLKNRKWKENLKIFDNTFNY